MVSLSLMEISQFPELEQSRPGLGQARLCSLEGGDPSGRCPVFLRPEKGALYFFSCSLFPLRMIDQPLQRLFTDTNMYNTGLREEMEEFYLYLEKIIRVKNLTIPSKKKNYDLVLDIMRTENQRVQWSYYFACHKARCLFWLDKYDASFTVYGVESPAHASVSPSFTNLFLYPLIYVQGIIWRIYIGTLWSFVKLNWFS
jgi:hypothetical protein